MSVMDFHELAGALDSSLERFAGQLVEAVVADVRFPRRSVEQDIAVARQDLVGLPAFAQRTLAGRRPLCQEGEEVVCLLSHNAAAWALYPIAGILLAGNRLRLKLPQRNPRTAEVLAAIAAAVFGSERVVLDRSPGAELIPRSLADPQVRAVVLYGSEATALHYEASVAASGKTFVLEGPGNDPFVVLEDCDLERAARDLVAAKFGIFCGQGCICPERVYVHASIYERFIGALADLSAGLPLGAPEDPQTVISPIASAVVLDRVRAQLADAAARGGRILGGGEIRPGLIAPTVVAGATPDMLGMREEVFAPVLYVARCGDDDEAVRCARNSPYGLSAAVYGVPEHAARVAAALRGAPYLEEVPALAYGRFGVVGVNQPVAGASFHRPFGGYGRSGWVWDVVGGRRRLRQGPKLLSIETSVTA